VNQTFLAALGLMLIFEGLLPFVLPAIWRETFKRMIELKDGQLRFVGLLSIVGGLLLLFFGR
jgi:uncharacterized protein YjeT (DUF2065 family)